MVGTRVWVLFAFQNYCQSRGGFLSMGGAITLAFLNPQLTHLPVRANVAEVVGQWLLAQGPETLSNS